MKTSKTIDFWVKYDKMHSKKHCQDLRVPYFKP
jgi:hypothetical protein